MAGALTWFGRGFSISSSCITPDERDGGEKKFLRNKFKKKLNEYQLVTSPSIVDTM
jgi:hypothetical protein